MDLTVSLSWQSIYRVFFEFFLGTRFSCIRTLIGRCWTLSDVLFFYRRRRPFFHPSTLIEFPIFLERDAVGRADGSGVVFFIALQSNSTENPLKPGTPPPPTVFVCVKIFYE